ncbi:putative CALMODULIN-BINDING PROTEIN60 [Helianthus annuus]|uniref:CALMODULIN-BINDING PROTEIN60 n=2 Tax=Helianthus annuus TaxID=4232 RepID=A0A251TZE6_HELAN|nr:calmodulin-binding protein 60 A isoform X1 [Helianthus annuus]KAF5792814.1 putative CALMODULIN-BINDING PROTEIN60 [Helianthus annuus]KAJ0890319.1 putative CALMODULIN-BINDING PROTEIN60 [Helianthus annuus]KAJ0895081.1 putative CALMODULIN-BINDING PROTEIN60 [Helianthus annuus]
MSLNEQRPEEESESESNITCSDLLSNLTRSAGELMVIRTIQRYLEPIFVPLFRPLIRQIVEERLGVAKQELLASLKENPLKKTRASTSVLRRLKLKFRNRIGLPVYTGIPLLGENHTPIEVALVDALTEQIVNTGTESTAKLEIMGFRVDDDDDGGWTFKKFQERVMSERKGRRTLQGNTCLQLKDGIGFVHEVRFTHDSKHTKNGSYRLGAVVVDAALMKQVEGTCTETFVVKDKRSKFYENHPYPFLSDKVYHLENIRYKGTRYKRLQDEKVETVRDLLILLYTDPKRLEDLLELKASSKRWGEIVKNAQSSNGMFLYLDPRKSGVVLDVRRQLKALIVEPHLYTPVNHLTDRQKDEAQNLVKFASQNLKALDYFEDETSLKKHLQSDPGFTSLPSITDGPPTTSSQVAEACLNNLNQTPFETSQSERGKEKVPFDDEMIYATNYYQEHISFHPPTLNGPNGVNFWSATSSQAAEPLVDTFGLVNTPDISSYGWEESDYSDIINYVSAILSDSPNVECLSTVSVCTIAGTRWRKVSKLLRRNSVRERIGLSQGMQPLKKQKCC